MPRRREDQIDPLPFAPVTLTRLSWAQVVESASEVATAASEHPADATRSVDPDGSMPGAAAEPVTSAKVTQVLPLNV